MRPRAITQKLHTYAGLAPTSSLPLIVVAISDRGNRREKIFLMMDVNYNPTIHTNT